MLETLPPVLSHHPSCSVLSCPTIPYPSVLCPVLVFFYLSCLMLCSVLCSFLCTVLFCALSCAHVLSCSLLCSVLCPVLSSILYYPLSCPLLCPVFFFVLFSGAYIKPYKSSCRLRGYSLGCTIIKKNSQSQNPNNQDWVYI